jgi:hypothetical protein
VDLFQSSKSRKHIVLVGHQEATEGFMMLCNTAWSGMERHDLLSGLRSICSLNCSWTLSCGVSHVQPYAIELRPSDAIPVLLGAIRGGTFRPTIGGPEFGIEYQFPGTILRDRWEEVLLLAELMEVIEELRS